jgi:hypothetical protein
VTRRLHENTSIVRDFSGENERKRMRIRVLRSTMDMLQRVDPDRHAELIAMMLRGETPQSE